MRAELADTVTEAALQQFVEDLAAAHGWLAYHTFDSRHSIGGFPDLVLCHPGPRGTSGDGAVVFAELKRQNGKLTIGQQVWLRSLHSAGAEAHVWRPADVDEIAARLRRKGQVR